MNLNVRKRKLISFLRELIAIPSPSGGEKEALDRVAREMKEIGWRDIHFDRAGNLRGKIGRGSRQIALDGHADTVGPGRKESWSCDPYRGKLQNGWVWGRGAADQKGGLAAAVYAGAFIRERRLEEDFTLHLVASVQEEDCEGISWDYIIEEEGFRPEAVILTEPSKLRIARGQKGHLEMLVTSRGRSAHSFCPEKGDNAVYRICALAGRIKEAAAGFSSHPEMGRGKIALTDISSRSPSDNSVPDFCRIRLDRRFCPGETRKSLLREIREIAGPKFKVEAARYREKNWKGDLAEEEKFFPSWLLPEEHPVIEAARRASREAWGRAARTTTWGFSTNGVSTMGKHKIPTFGLGPGAEEMAHRSNERVEAKEVVKAALFYARFPGAYCREKAKGKRISNNQQGISNDLSLKCLK